ncbi:hypothetical protein [Microbacterium sp. Leaf320]|uniref:hypothetical protein n=1 Tax=Microbacterium sp. Leaf320 TaxID=1736334 RepID=UPI0006FA90AF|nr:hypothetical protein [Microbacterium sp. Leaf320]KQQ65721.1 hypothetical protein ASF63_10195 [Microbacterium sp. Leaf320]
MRPSDPWTSADYWFADFIEHLEDSRPRLLKLQRERVEIPEAVEAARDYEHETEQLRRVIVVERERWFAEQGKTA